MSEISSANVSEGIAMKKALVIALTDIEMQELYRILLDRDKDAAWDFVDTHARAPLHKALEGG